MKTICFPSLISLAILLFGIHPATAFDPRSEPEAATRSQIETARAQSGRTHMVVTANPLASRAGLAMLRRGGSATDAMIAAQLVLNLVEPQSSGLGGGGFLLHWDAARQRLSSLDGRETAPLAATPDRFMQDGKPMPFRQAAPGGLSVGTPGLPHLLAKAHRKHGRLPWPVLFQPAIRLARTGFAISPRLHKLLGRMPPESFGKKARAYFFDKTGQPRPVGHLLKNPAFAKTLQGIARQGSNAFYRGRLAGEIVATVRNAERNPGDLRRADLALYRAHERPPVCTRYRGYRLCGMGPPSSGMLTLGQILKLLEPFDLDRQPMNSRALHLIAEASKLAYADRGRYMADSDFTAVPHGLLHPAYLARRRALIDPHKSMGKAQPGKPPGTPAQGRDATRENKGTSHLSIVDRWGNAISLTSSIEAAFGARLMVGGFLLNNELTDFSFRPTDEKGRPIANRVQPMKRPRSSMSPVLIFAPDGRLHMIAGSPGGSRIILYVLKAIVGHIDWRLGPRDLVELPNFGSRNGPLELEKGPGAGRVAERLRAFGHEVRQSDMTSGLHLVIRTDSGWRGAADPRREGLPLGD